MTAAAFLKVLVVALSLGLDVFAVCVGVGLRGGSPGLKVRIGLAFTAAEMTMTLIGVGLGRLAGGFLGDVAGYLGFAALIVVGVYMLYESGREGREGLDLSRGWGLFLGSVSISLDSLGIGFSIVYIGVPLLVSVIVIGATSALSTSMGLTLGRALGARAEESSTRWAGIILIATGAAFAALHATGSR